MIKNPKIVIRTRRSETAEKKFGISAINIPPANT